MRMGKRSKPSYRIIVLDKRKKRNGAYIENIGFYDPLANPPVLSVNPERLKEWTSKGAVVSEGMEKLLKYMKKKSVKKD